jgi:hypothetical protein
MTGEHVLRGKWNCMAGCKTKVQKKGERMSKGMFGRGDLAWCVGQNGLAVAIERQCRNKWV